MKLNPPKVIVDKNEPFKEALFGREEFAKSLTNLLRNAEENLVIFVHAPWGEGKTTFAEMWRAHLELQKLEVIYFDAYAVDYFEDPFVSFSGEILALVDKQLAKKTGKPARREFKKTAIEVGKRLAGLTAKIGIRAATMGAADATHVAELKGIASDAATGFSEIGADIIEKKIENYTAEKDALVAFKKSLAKLAKLFRDEHGFPLTIIVDELDRCRPDFALSLLERIKHLFDVEGLAFVLLVNRAQIESYIHTIYGEVDAKAYLLKFGSLFIDLPHKMRADRYERGRSEYCQSLASHYSFPDQTVNSEFFARSMGIFANHFDLTLREIEKAFTTAAIYFASSTPGPYSNRFENEWLVALLSILKIKMAKVYSALAKDVISADSFYQETRLDHLKLGGEQRFNWLYINALLDFYLMSEAELKKAVESPDEKNAQLRQFASNWGGTARNKEIPNLCSSLDRFSLNPK